MSDGPLRPRCPNDTLDIDANAFRAARKQAFQG
jgi:hypothetical protein